MCSGKYTRFDFFYKSLLLLTCNDDITIHQTCIGQCRQHNKTQKPTQV